MKKETILLSLFLGFTPLVSHADLGEGYGVTVENIEGNSNTSSSDGSSSSSSNVSSSGFSSNFYDYGQLFLEKCDYSQGFQKCTFTENAGSAIYNKPDGGQDFSGLGLGSAVVGGVAGAVANSEAAKEAIGEIIKQGKEAIFGTGNNTAGNTGSEGGSNSSGSGSGSNSGSGSTPSIPGGIGSPPNVTLLYGPTPTGDIFSFCAGGRPGRRSEWRYWYDYLCSGNPKQDGNSFIGFGH